MFAATPAHARDNRTAFIGFGEIADAPAGFVEMCRRDAAVCGAAPVVPEPIAEITTPACLTFIEPFGAAVVPIATIDDAGCAQDASDAVSSREPGWGQPTGALAATPLLSAPPDRQGAGAIKLVQSINTRVNAGVVQRSDREQFGVDEFWRPSGVGPGAVGDCEDIALEKRDALVKAGMAPDRLFLAVVFHRKLGLHTVLVARLDDGDYVLDSANGWVRRWDRMRYSWLRVQSPDQPLRWNRVATG